MSNTGNTQQIIDYGVTANDGTGDPLRTAFIKTDENFSNIWLAGPVGSNITISNNTIGVQNTNGNLALKPNGVGVVESRNSIVPSINSVYDLGSPNNHWRIAYVSSVGTENLSVSGNVTIDGNLTVLGNINGNTGNVGNYGDPNVVNLLRNFGSNSISTSGNIIGGRLGAPGGLSSNGQVLFSKNGFIGVSNYDFNFDESTYTLYVKVGSFSGDLANGSDALYAGIAGATYLGSAVMAQITGNVENYSQLNFQNINGSAQASGDYIITADNGDDTSHFVNLGMTSSNWDGSQTNSLGNLIGPTQGYLYVQDGNLAVGTKVGDTPYIWNFDTTGNLTVAGNIVTAIAPASGNIVSNVSHWDSAGANLYVWFDAASRPDVQAIGAYGNIVGWTVAVEDGNQALVTDTNPAGYFSISTDQALTGAGNLTFTSPDYVPEAGVPLTVQVGDHGWTFESTGDLSAPGNINTTGNITAAVINTLPVLASTLPTPSSVGSGSRAFVTDADSRTWGNLLNGSGANSVPVWTDGSNWYIG